MTPDDNRKYPANMANIKDVPNKKPYRCKHCGNVLHKEIASRIHWQGDEYPPKELFGVCDRDTGGCGKASNLKLA